MTPEEIMRLQDSADKIRRGIKLTAATATSLALFITAAEEVRSDIFQTTITDGAGLVRHLLGSR